MSLARSAIVWPKVKLAIAIPAALLATSSPARGKEAPPSGAQQKKPSQAQAKGKASAVIMSDVLRITLDSKGRVHFDAPGHHTRSVEKDGTQLVNLQ